MVPKKPAKQAPQKSLFQKVKMQGMGMKATVHKQGFVAYSPRFKGFVARHRGALSAVSILLSKNFSRLQEAQVVGDAPHNIRIQRAATGSYGGHTNRMTLKVSVGKKQFFLKIPEGKIARAIFEGTRMMDDYLKRRNYRVHGFNVRVIKPHLLVDRGSGNSYILTDFFGENEVILAHDLPRRSITEARVRDTIDSVLNELSYAFRDKKLGEISFFNAFYRPRDKTLLLFDLEFSGGD